jgi:anti-sigma factor RsiW
MTCERESDLTAFVDGELPPFLARQVEEHLAACRSCRATETLLRTVATGCAALPSPSLSPAARGAVLARIAALPAPSGWLERLQARVMIPALGFSMAVAAAVVVLVRTQRGPAELTEPAALELFAELELVEDYDVLGLESPDDLDVVENLQALEVSP